MDIVIFYQYTVQSALATCRITIGLPTENDLLHPIFIDSYTLLGDEFLTPDWGSKELPSNIPNNYRNKYRFLNIFAQSNTWAELQTKITEIKDDIIERVTTVKTKNQNFITQTNTLSASIPNDSKEIITI